MLNRKLLEKVREFGVENLLSEINLQCWKFAKTYAKIAPHEYILKEWNPTLFNKITELITSKGYNKFFWGFNYKYFDIGEYKYWQIKNILNRTLINGELTHGKQD